MDDKTYWLAIDIGASSGRAILGEEENGMISTQEVYRFPNGPKEKDGHLVWDLDYLFSQVKEGIKAAFSLGRRIKSLAIDTWGCDYVLLNGGSAPTCFSYRDKRTYQAVDAVHSIVPFPELYKRTGIQFQSFNTIYQLYEDKLQGRLDSATDFLMLPEYLSFLLTGVKRKEYTNATTTGLINGDSKSFDSELLGKLGLPQRLFGRLCNPGSPIGELLPEIAREVGGNCRVCFCASHDTASSVEGVILPPSSLYLSSGTWSLLGVKTDKMIVTDAAREGNFSNEGGPSYIRFQKNIMGMWVINRLKEELCPDQSYQSIIKLARQSKVRRQIDINDRAFLSPDSMAKAILDKTDPKYRVGDLFKIAFASLAKSYADTIGEIEAITGEGYQKLVIFGGGAKNAYLNDLTQRYSGKEIIALPIEATSLGNLKIQMKGANI